MYKFQPNDQFEVKENGLRGLISAVSFNSIHQEEEYYVIWDAFPDKGEICYMAADVGDLWAKIGEIADATEDWNGYLPNGVYKVDESYSEKCKKVEPEGMKTKECEHKWVEVGFTHTKEVCKFCDTEKA